MTSAQVIETSVNVTSNSPSQDYTHPDDHNLRTYGMTPGLKQFTVLLLYSIQALLSKTKNWPKIRHEAVILSPSTVKCTQHLFIYLFINRQIVGVRQLIDQNCLNHYHQAVQLRLRRPMSPRFDSRTRHEFDIVVGSRPSLGDYGGNFGDVNVKGTMNAVPLALMTQMID